MSHFYIGITFLKIHYHLLILSKMCLPQIFSPSLTRYNPLSTISLYLTICCQYLLLGTWLVVFPSVFFMKKTCFPASQHALKPARSREVGSAPTQQLRVWDQDQPLKQCVVIVCQWPQLELQPRHISHFNISHTFKNYSLNYIL